MKVFPLTAIILLAVLPSLSSARESARDELDRALRSTPDVERGAGLFHNCAVCHGPQGGGTSDGGVPRIAGQHVSVLIKQLVDYRHDRRWDIRMEHFADNHHLADSQSLADVAAYIHQLKAQSPPGVGDGELVSHGASLYASRCESCHGAAAQGNAQARVPRIAGQHFEYLMRQIYDAADGRRPNFSTAHIQLLRRLDRRDIVGVADYLSRLETTQFAGSTDLVQVHHHAHELRQ
jgi:cytochrome c553